MTVEPFQYAERKHAQDVRKLHVLQSIHAKAAVTNVICPAKRGIRDGQGRGSRVPDAAL